MFDIVLNVEGTYLTIQIFILLHRFFGGGHFTFQMKETLE